MRSPDPGWTGLLVVLGVVQTGFLASAIAGLLMTPKTVVRVPVPIFARTPRRFEWTVAPTLNGLALSGRF